MTLRYNIFFMSTLVILILSTNTVISAQKKVLKDATAVPPWGDRSFSSFSDTAKIAGTLSRETLSTLLQRGEILFTARFTTLDGVGRPMATQAIIPTKRRRLPRQAFSRTAGVDANACASCHNVPAIGGAGDFTANVFVSEGFQQSEFDSTDPQFSNERNTNHLFGAGLIELLAREMSAELAAQRQDALTKARTTDTIVTVKLVSKSVSFGTVVVHPDGLVDTRNLQGIDTDLVIRPFSHKGVMTSLRQFTINALNQHHGMQASERFGARWTGTTDFDEDNIVDEISPGDVSALVAWQATLAPPSTATPPSPDWQAAATRGDALFSMLECDSCHRRALPLTSLSFSDPGPLDNAGTLRSNENSTTHNAVYNLGLFEWAKQLPRNPQGDVLVPLFGDLKRHAIADNQVATLGNELLSQRFVDRNVFMTSELWGVGSTAPYGHRGDLSTLGEVIIAHGGDARTSRDAYLALGVAARSDVNAYLKTFIINP